MKLSAAVYELSS